MLNLFSFLVSPLSAVNNPYHYCILISQRVVGLYVNVHLCIYVTTEALESFFLKIYYKYIIMILYDDYIIITQNIL